jgi:butyrate kinase
VGGRVFVILAINPGSTSTKIALFEDEQCIFIHSIYHDVDDLAGFETVNDQAGFRLDAINQKLQEEHIAPAEIDAFVGRGGLLKPIPSGTYTVDDTMLHDLSIGILGEHASNLGGILAHKFASEFKKPAYIVDPVVVDELQDVARFSGHPLFPRKSIFHALNQKSVGRQAAENLGKTYDQVKLVIAHLGGGISIGAHKNGRVIDVNNALDGEGPFSPERSGTLPARDLVNLCFSGDYNAKEIQKMIRGNGGLAAYVGTNDLRKARQFISEQGSDSFANLICQSMVYQIAKEIGSMAVVLEGKVDAIVLTGGITLDKQFVKDITKYISFLGTIIVIPGEEEMSALSNGAFRVLIGEENAKDYKDHELKNDFNIPRTR